MDGRTCYHIIGKGCDSMEDLKAKITTDILNRMQGDLSDEQYDKLQNALDLVLYDYRIEQATYEVAESDGYILTNEKIMNEYFGTLMLEGKSKKTIERYRLVMKMLLEHFGKSIKKITTSDLRYYLAWYKETRKVSGTTLDGMRRVFTACFNWLEKEDYIYKSPARRISRIKKDTKKERELYESEIEMLAQCCRSLRDRALLEFMYATAARVSEVAKVNIDEVDFEQKSVLLHGKGDKDRISYFTDKAEMYLKKYLDTRTDSNPALFVSLKNPEKRVTKDSIEQMVRTLGRKSGVTGSHPHRFRVTRITVLVNRGMPLQDVQELAGHSDINTTRMYYRSNKERVRYEYLKVS